MLFRSATLAGIAVGEVTHAYRRWTRPSVRAGGTLRTAVGVLAIDRVEPVAIEAITAQDAKCAGYDSLDELRAELGKARSGTLYRISFHVAGEDPRVALRRRDRLDDRELAELRDRLAALDRGSRAGPWTLSTLALIASRDGITAAEIAAALQLAKPAIKVKIRKLKELGLTESLAVGYRLSPRGRASFTALSDEPDRTAHARLAND